MPLFAKMAKNFMRVTQPATTSDEIWKVSFFEMEGVIRKAHEILKWKVSIDGSWPMDY